MNFQVFHVNPGKKLKKKDVNNDLSHFMSVFPILGRVLRMDYSSPTYPKFTTIICCGCDGCIKDEILIGRPMFLISTKPK